MRDVRPVVANQSDVEAVAHDAGEEDGDEPAQPADSGESDEEEVVEEPGAEGEDKEAEEEEPTGPRHPANCDGCAVR